MGQYLCFWEAHAEIYTNKETQCKKAILKDSSSTHGQHWTLKPDGLNLAPRTKCRKRANPKSWPLNFKCTPQHVCPRALCLSLSYTRQR